MRYEKEGVPLMIFAGKEYGTGSSRDWAAKGPALLGVNAVIAVSYERIHRSNLLMMGILPLEFPAGQSADSLGLTGEETYALAICLLEALGARADELTIKVFGSDLSEPCSCRSMSRKVVKRSRILARIGFRVVASGPHRRLDPQLVDFAPGSA